MTWQSTWDDNVGLDFCQDVLTTLQSDLDTSLRQAEPELADVISSRASKTRQNAETYLI